MRRVSRITIIALSCALAAPAVAITVSVAASATAASSQTAKNVVTYTGTRGSAQRITAGTYRASVHRAVSPVVHLSPLAVMAPASINGPVPPASSVRAPVTGASITSPVTATGMTLNRQASVQQVFNGLSDLDNAGFGGEVTPPDQGLCAGHDPSLAGRPTAVWEAVNDAVREIAPDGTQLRPDQGVTSLFADPNAFSDPRCMWDPLTSTFIFTVIGFPLATGPNASLTNTTVDVTVLNSHGFASYQFDTSLGGQCLGDQPKLGFNGDAVIVSTDEFCGPQQNNFEGAIALVISLRQLVNEDATVNDAVLGPLSLPGNIVLGLDPANGPGLSDAYLVNSFPFDGNGNNNPTANTLGMWTITNTGSVTRGIGSPSISGTIIPSETYGFPIDAASTGTGKVDHTVVIGKRSFPIISEAFLAANDSRVNSQIEAIRVFGDIQLYAALTTSLTPSGDSAVRDGAAWFKISATSRTVVDQGYVSTPGAYLLYPVIVKSTHGTPVMAFTITSPTINPSAAFTTLGSGSVSIAAAGAGPHTSFSDAPPFNRPRWGDYTAAAVLPDDSGIWLATEYVPPAASQDRIDNWGTAMFKVSG